MTKKTPTKHDIEQSTYFVNLSLYACALDIATTELVECMVREGVYKHVKKQRIKQVQKMTDYVYGWCGKVYSNSSEDVEDGYNRRAWQLFKDIEQHISLQGSTKWYNIIVALSVLIKELNQKLIGRYEFEHAKQVYNVPSLLECLRLKYEPIMERIIKGIDTNIKITD